MMVLVVIHNTVSAPETEHDLTLPFIGMSLMLTSVLMLFYYRAKRNCEAKRVFAFASLLLGEGMLFPWYSTLDWIKLAMIATTNYVLGTQTHLLDGVAEWLKCLFRKPPGYGPQPPLVSGGTDAAGATRNGGVSAESNQSDHRRITERSDLLAMEVLKRMLYPDLRWKL